MKHNFDRRQLLLGGASLFGGMALWPGRARAGSLAGFTAPEEGGRPKYMVLVQMFGGNDPLNTIVPHGDDLYYKHRPVSRILKDEVLPLDDYRGFNPVMPGFHKLWNDGNLAIVEGVGYPTPILSHFKSLDIWHAARTDGKVGQDGWVGRLRAKAWPDDPRGELIAHVGNYVPNSIRSQQYPPLTFKAPESYLWIGGEEERETFSRASEDREMGGGNGRDAVLSRLRRNYRQAEKTAPKVMKAIADYEPRAEYPRGEFGHSLKTMAAMIKANFPTRIFSVDIRGFDTHATQRGQQDGLLAQVDRGITALLNDLKGTDAYDKTLVVAFSEFGRRVPENYSRGTDHGAAGSMFLAGPMVKGGLKGGGHPSLAELDADENLIYTTDFRHVYASVIEQHWGLPQEGILDRKYPTLDLVG